MIRKIWLAAILGLLLGVGLGYTPQISPPRAPRAQLILQRPQQPTLGEARPQAAYDFTALLIALALGLALATPVFVVAKSRSKQS